jgi:Fe-S-cluster containining protein
VHTFQVENLAAELKEIHDDLTIKTKNFKEKSTLDCIKGCGKCCLSDQVEALPGEWLPLALDIATGRNNSYGSLEDLMEDALQNQSSHCVMYRPHPDNPEQGFCGAYAYRPIVCRLFGFSTTRSKHQKNELITCRPIKNNYAEFFFKQNIDLSSDHVPSNSEYWTKVHSLFAMHPTLGISVSINKALAIALEFIGLRSNYEKKSDKNNSNIPSKTPIEEISDLPQNPPGL